MRKKAILLYKNEEDRTFLLGKTERLPWLSCQAALSSSESRPQDCHLLIGRAEDLCSLLTLKREALSNAQLPLLVFSANSQFPVLRMVEGPSCKVVNESIGTQSLGEEVLSLIRAKPEVCKESPPCTLTLRERQVVALILSGEENKAIAAKMGIKLSTVYAHKKNLFLKTGMHTTSQLVVWALLREFVP
ncbi:MAG: helix-turn-helix transcriptional regulator [Sphaerochaeta sp.]|nr:helix-turn-helix transcriptional regulator [Sphaerochaeta sp.]